MGFLGYTRILGDTRGYTWMHMDTITSETVRINPETGRIPDTGKYYSVPSGTCVTYISNFVTSTYYASKIGAIVP